MMVYISIGQIVLVRGRWWLGEDPALKPNKDYDKQVKELEITLTNLKVIMLDQKMKRHLPFECNSWLV